MSIVKCTALLLLVLVGLVTKATSQAPAPAPGTTNPCDLLPAVDLKACAGPVFVALGTSPLVPLQCAKALQVTAAITNKIGRTKVCQCIRQILTSPPLTPVTSPISSNPPGTIDVSLQIKLLAQSLGISLSATGPCP